MTSDSFMNKWLLGIPYEVAFWEATYSNKQSLKSLFQFSHLGSQITLDGFDVRTFLLQQPKPFDAVILDVGAGMTFFPGNLLEDAQNQSQLKPINIHYLDPLAQYYNQIAEKHHVEVPKVEFAMMEYLSAFYPMHDVSLIIINNALDHSAQPVKGIIEAINCLHTGGVLYLNHHPNEAEYEHYRGFHQYNIMIENSQLIIWNQTQKHNINELLQSFADVKTTICGNNPVAVITKTAPVPQHLLQKDTDISTLSNALLDYSVQVTSPLAMFQYHSKLIYYRLVQHLSKLFSFEIRQKIKSFINKLS